MLGIEGRTHVGRISKGSGHSLSLRPASLLYNFPLEKNILILIPNALVLLKARSRGRSMLALIA